MDYIKYQGKCWVPSGDWFTGKPVGDVEEMIAKARSQAFEECAVIVDGWHIKKGGYGLLAEAIRRKGADV